MSVCGVYVSVCVWGYVCGGYYKHVSVSVCESSVYVSVDRMYISVVWGGQMVYKCV